MNIQVKIETREELEAKGVKDLKALCKKYQFEGYSSLSKEDVINSLLDFFENLDSFEGFERFVDNTKVVFHRKPKLGKFNPMTMRKR